jgi:hypothetical protein
MLTIPGPNQVVCKRFETIIIRNYDFPESHDRFWPRVLSELSELNSKGYYSFSFTIIKALLSSMDSDLEAFSHNPTDGSFTALVFQLTVFTNYLNQLFLSY